MKSKCCISGECLNALAVALANTTAKNFTDDELAQLAVLFNLIGDAFGVIAASRAVCASSKDPPDCCPNSLK